VNNQNVTAQSAALKDILRVSSADREKFDKLNNLRFVFGFIVDMSMNIFRVNLSVIGFYRATQLC